MQLVKHPIVEVFKTNVRSERQASAVLRGLHARFPKCRINFDLTDCDKILRIEGMIPSPETVIEMLQANGYECAVLE